MNCQKEKLRKYFHFDTWQNQYNIVKNNNKKFTIVSKPRNEFNQGD